MFISTYANKTTFILYIFILTLFYVWYGICGGGVNYQNFADIYRKRNKNYE